MTFTCFGNIRADPYHANATGMGDVCPGKTSPIPVALAAYQGQLHQVPRSAQLHRQDHRSKLVHPRRQVERFSPVRIVDTYLS